LRREVAIELCHPGTAAAELLYPSENLGMCLCLRTFASTQPLRH
jgi:hypothetical protein